MIEFSAKLITPNFEIPSITVVTIEILKIFNIIPPAKTPNFAVLIFQIWSYGLI